MFSIDEIKARIIQSNLSAMNQRGNQEPYPVGMARLINSIHRFHVVNDEDSDLDGIWHPPPGQSDSLFGDHLLDLYRGAFARTSVGSPLEPGKRGRTAVYSLFRNNELKASINRMLTVSRDDPAHLVTVDWVNNCVMTESQNFWDRCEENDVSVIYRSKTLSMAFPDLFVPFDTRSMNQLRADNRTGKLPRKITWPHRNIRWSQFIDAHKAFQELCCELININRDSEEGALRYCRNLSLHSDNNCSAMFERISCEVGDSPPPITRFIDKIFYMPGQN